MYTEKSQMLKKETKESPVEVFTLSQPSACIERETCSHDYFHKGQERSESACQDENSADLNAFPFQHFDTFSLSITGQT